MKQRTLGMVIASLRKENGMTQLDLAEKIGVTDKAVSKYIKTPFRFSKRADGRLRPPTLPSHK